MDYLSSMYIDNEMDLDEKRQFVERVRSDDTFYTETVELLDQEHLLRELPVMPPERASATPWQQPLRTVLARWFRPLGFATAGFTAAVLMLFTVFQPPPAAICNNRFVLFEPAAKKVELTGSFTGWQLVSMTRAGTSGYWEINLQVPSGEHRFAYILDGKRQLADPTLPASEKDDFGGQNSIFNVEEHL